MGRRCAELALLIMFGLLAACVEQDDAQSPDLGQAKQEVGTAPCQAGSKRCVGATLEQCEGGKWKQTKSCTGTQVCSASLGDCADCEPSKGACVGDAAHACTAQGKVGAKIKVCPAGTCLAGKCVDLCNKARAARSYIGCDYWPTVTVNASLAGDFSFAVAVANTSTGAATVDVASMGNPKLKSVTVPARSVATIALPWVKGLKQLPSVFGSVQLQASAYKLTSNRPVSVYQFNALDYVLNHDCKLGGDQKPGDNKCYSYSNDASLLVPEHTFGTEYMVLSRPSMLVLQLGKKIKSPGFFSVVAASAGSTKLTVNFSANTEAGGGNVKAYKKGDTGTFTLKQWEVLQVLSALPDSCKKVKSDNLGNKYCDLSDTTDLTGTVIKSDQPVAVFAGHNCSFVPYDKWACDHLEETIFPTASMGKHYIGSHSISSGDDPSLYRVVSAAGENIITFNPQVEPTRTLGKGEWFEFTTRHDFEVKGTGRFALVKFMVGQNYSTTAGAGAPNDPAMALAVPVEQYRDSYHFLAPASYQKNYVNIHAPAGAAVKLDGVKLPSSAFLPVNTSSKMTVGKVQITGGAHLIESTDKVGITVYGVGSYTSYMYPGGLDLKLLL